MVDLPTSGTAVQLLNQKDRVAWIKFSPGGTNSSRVYVGRSDVSSTNGAPLGIGLEPVEWDFRPDTERMDSFFAVSTTSGDDIIWEAIFTR